MTMYKSCIFEEEEEEEEEDQFFDSREEISSSSDSCQSSPSKSLHSSNWVLDDPRYKVWISNPGNIQERRDKFMRWLGLGHETVQSPRRDSSIDLDIERITSDGGAVLMSSGLENNSSSMSAWSSDGPHTSDDGSSEESVEFRIKNLDNGSVFVADQFSTDGTLKSLREVGSNRSITLDEFEKSFGPSSFVHKLMQKEEKNSGIRGTDRSRTLRSRRKNGWLRKLGIVTCVVDRSLEGIEPNTSSSDQSLIRRVQRVRVCTNNKRSKEFSAVYMGQDIKGHDGAILTLKCSPDGQYLASAGEDGVVRVWKVVECERRDEGEIPEDDPSCIFFKVNHHSELAPLYGDKKKVKSGNMKRTSDSACVVVPPEVFLISEKPVHEFYGHEGDVLDLSWSKDKYLLSSSLDKTARLWKVGCHRCLKIFAHNNYVTCVQFNPVDANYFVSGSIDGKVRIWELKECRVVDWIDSRDIVTALSYRLDGQGIVVGTMTGDCRFYDASDNQLQLEAQMTLQAKKKSLEKRITGFQYCPSDHRKLMVTSADSQIRILNGVDVISKYRGLRNGGSQISASFTSDGKHIISASEDSNVYVWSHTDNDSPTVNLIKSTWSYERFISTHASVAIPWHAMASRDPVAEAPQGNTVYLSPAGSFTLGNDFFSEFLPKGPATWPEEKLNSSSRITTSTLRKSQYKFLKTSCTNSSHAWGQVIITAGWDGRIKSFHNYGLPVNR